MGNNKKALPNQSLPDVKATRKKAIAKLNIALKVAGFALRLIAIIEKIAGWLG